MIGVLAGMGPYSTGPFLNLVLKQCEIQYGAKDDIDFPKIVVYSWPTPFFPDRAVDHHAMTSSIKEGLSHLEKSEAGVIAIACNTAHVYFSEIQSTVTKPLLNMVNLAIEALPREFSKVAVIGSRVTAESNIYQVALSRAGFKPVDPPWQNEIDELIRVVRTHPEVVREKIEKLLLMAENYKVECLLLACLDLSSVGDYFVGKTCLVDSSQVLARNLVQSWLALEEEKN